MPHHLLEVVTQGNLQLEKRRPEVEECMQYLKNRPNRQPGIYMLELVHETTKEAPSIRILERILQIATDYVELRDHDAARRIDEYMKIKEPTAETTRNVYRGRRAYMERPEAQVPNFYQLKDHFNDQLKNTMESP
ncbi:hypothetical protein M409DRAFT_56886 [Zasmidium cellare ATCC 36951]|uniref:Uncharacterized protein n=1 Tax=Zasmidium cellare ATCC 36951 TaxID=1080233 RepID=A0A6A6CDB1_ZASCE|nr:uncharacterized protein M409DRAFT_56886 [Zasmidium cellare ATCC 36951]KAF2164190.1 hypothetical protein M409DRAFT_56886 [Zasmidium cellare ATCC 36951]